MTKRTTAMIVLAPLALAACTQGEPRKVPPPSPAAEAIGEPLDCLSITQFSSTKIRDDRTIDFMAVGNKVWRVTLPNSCPGLKSDDAFTYATSLTKLCSTDIIYPLRHYGGRYERGPGCGMGQFVPVKLIK